MTKQAPKRRSTPLRSISLGKPLSAIDQAALRLDEAQNPIQLLKRLDELRAAVIAAIDSTVTVAHAGGSTWPTIAAQLKVSPQAVQQRVKRLQINPS